MNPSFLREAIQLSIRNVMSLGGGPFGAVIVREGQIVGRGWNQVTATNDPTAHAEVVAIRDACAHLKTFSLAGCEMYTSCEPCPMCLSAIHWARMDQIYYGASWDDAEAAGFRDAQLYRELCLPPDKRSIPAEQALREEARAAFAAWMKKENRTQY